MTPRRVQLSRRKGWRKPPGAIIVSRPSRWGNPFRVIDTGRLYVHRWRVHSAGGGLCGAYPTKRDAAYAAVDLFELHIGPMGLNEPDDWDTWIFPLRGHDLACWCPLDQPCHGSVLLNMANR